MSAQRTRIDCVSESSHNLIQSLGETRYLSFHPAKSLFENYPYCGRLRLPMAASATKMGLHRSPLRFQPHFYRFLALENLAQPRDGIIFKQALRKISFLDGRGKKKQNDLSLFSGRATASGFKSGFIRFRQIRIRGSGFPYCRYWVREFQRQHSRRCIRFETGGNTR